MHWTVRIFGWMDGVERGPQRSAGQGRTGRAVAYELRPGIALAEAAPMRRAGGTWSGFRRVFAAAIPGHLANSRRPMSGDTTLRCGECGPVVERSSRLGHGRRAAIGAGQSPVDTLR